MTQKSTLKQSLEQTNLAFLALEQLVSQLRLPIVSTEKLNAEQFQLPMRIVAKEDSKMVSSS